MELKVHHIGYAVPDIEKAQSEFSALGWHLCGVITDDDSRKVRITFMEKDGYRIELVAPLCEDSPIGKTLRNGSGTPYHFCYEVDDLDQAERELKSASFIPFRKAAPAPAIDGRRVEFLFAKNGGILELVEKSPM